MPFFDIFKDRQSQISKIHWPIGIINIIRKWLSSDGTRHFLHSINVCRSWALIFQLQTCSYRYSKPSMIWHFGGLRMSKILEKRRTTSVQSLPSSSNSWINWWSIWQYSLNSTSEIIFVCLLPNSYITSMNLFSLAWAFKSCTNHPVPATGSHIVPIVIIYNITLFSVFFQMFLPYHFPYIGSFKYSIWDMV